MKKILSFVMVAVLAVMLAGCEKYDDSELRSRVSALESLNTYQTLLQKLQAGKTVTAYSQSGNDITLTFSDGSTVTFNQQGVPGESIQGPAGVTPQFKIEGTSWKVSYDDGKTWQNAGDAVEKSLFKDVKVNDAGDTLLITLADGTTIPVFYGEKEGYGFEVAGGRKCFSFYEDLETECTGKMTLNYTLSGDLQSSEDVKFVTNINFYPMSSDYPNGAVTIEPVDAKSGTITVVRQEAKAESGTAFFRDGEYWIDFPGMNIDIMAVFPDGSVRVQQIRIMYEYISLWITDGDAYFYEGEDGYVWIDLPATAGSVSFTLDHTICNYKADRELYDGEPFPQRPFTDCFNVKQNGSTIGTNAWNVTTSVGTTKVIDNSGGITYEYPVTFSYNANTSSKERRTWFEFMKKHQVNISGGLIYWPIYVHQDHN